MGAERGTGRFGLDIGEHFLSERVVRYKVPWVVVELPSLEMFKRCVDVALGVMWQC